MLTAKERKTRDIQLKLTDKRLEKEKEKEKEKNHASTAVKSTGKKRTTDDEETTQGAESKSTDKKKATALLTVSQQFKTLNPDLSPLAIAFGYLANMKRIMLEGKDNNPFTKEESQQKIVSLALFYNIFKAFEAIRKHRNPIDFSAENAALFHKIVMYFNDDTNEALLQTAEQLSSELSEETLSPGFFFKYRPQGTDYRIPQKHLVAFAELLKVPDSEKFEFNPNYRPVIEKSAFVQLIEKTPLYQALYTGRDQQCDQALMKSALSTFAKTALVIFRQLNKPEYAYHDHPEDFDRFNHQAIDALKILLAMVGHYYGVFDVSNRLKQSEAEFVNTYGDVLGKDLRLFFQFLAQVHESIQLPVFQKFPDACTYDEEISAALRLLSEVKDIQNVFDTLIPSATARLDDVAESVPVPEQTAVTALSQSTQSSDVSLVAPVDQDIHSSKETSTSSSGSSAMSVSEQKEVCLDPIEWMRGYAKQTLKIGSHRQLFNDKQGKRQQDGWRFSLTLSDLEFEGHGISLIAAKKNAAEKAYNYFMVPGADKDVKQKRNSIAPLSEPIISVSSPSAAQAAVAPVVLADEKETDSVQTIEATSVAAVSEQQDHIAWMREYAKNTLRMSSHGQLFNNRYGEKQQNDWRFSLKLPDGEVEGHGMSLIAAKKDAAEKAYKHFMVPNADKNVKKEAQLDFEKYKQQEKIKSHDDVVAQQRVAIKEYAERIQMQRKDILQLFHQRKREKKRGGAGWTFLLSLGDVQFIGNGETGRAAELDAINQAFNYIKQQPAKDVEQSSAPVSAVDTSLSTEQSGMRVWKCAIQDDLDDDPEDAQGASLQATRQGPPVTQNNEHSTIGIYARLGAPIPSSFPQDAIRPLTTTLVTNMSVQPVTSSAVVTTHHQSSSSSVAYRRGMNSDNS